MGEAMYLESHKNSVGNWFLWFFGVSEIKKADPFVPEDRADETDRYSLHKDQNMIMRVLLNETVQPASRQAMRDSAALQEVAASLKT